MSQTKFPQRVENLSISLDNATDWLNTNTWRQGSVSSTDNDFSGGSHVTNFLYLSQFDFNFSPFANVSSITIHIERQSIGEVKDYYVGLVYPDGEDLVTSPGKQESSLWQSSETVSYGGDQWEIPLTVDLLNHPDFGIAIAVEGMSGADLAKILSVTMECETAAMSFGVTYNQTGSGSAELGGSAVLENYYVPTGGIEAGSEAVHQSTYNQITAHGIRLSGDVNIDGNITLSGQVVTWSIYHDVPTIDIESISLVGVNGFTLVNLGVNGLGPLISGQASTFSMNITRIRSGLTRFQILKKDTTKIETAINMPIGVRAASSALVSSSESEVLSGGAEVAGEPYVSLRRSDVASGGMEVGGTALMNNRFVVPSAAHGLLIDSDTSGVLFYKASQISEGGGVLCTGVAARGVLRTHTTSGGARCGGTSIVVIDQKIGGGVECGGGHELAWFANVVATSGGAKCAPKNVSTMSQVNISIASVRVGGKARYEKRRYRETYDGTSGLAMTTVPEILIIPEANDLIVAEGDGAVEATPVLFEYEQLPTWCLVEDYGKGCDAVVPKIVLDRQDPYMPIKDRGSIPTAQQIARSS